MLYKVVRILILTLMTTATARVTVVPFANRMTGRSIDAWKKQTRKQRSRHCLKKEKSRVRYFRATENKLTLILYVCVCTYECIYIYIYIYTYIDVYIYIYIHTHTD